LKSPLATMPASSTAPSDDAVVDSDFNNTWMIVKPWPRGCANSVRTGASHDNHSSFATNSWHLGCCTSAASWDKPPRLRKDAMTSGNRSLARTTALRAMRASSSASTFRSMTPRRLATRSASRSRLRADSEAFNAPDSIWHKRVRPPDCRVQ